MPRARPRRGTGNRDETLDLTAEETGDERTVPACYTGRRADHKNAIEYTASSEPSTGRTDSSSPPRASTPTHRELLHRLWEQLRGQVRDDPKPWSGLRNNAGSTERPPCLRSGVRVVYETNIAARRPFHLTHLEGYSRGPGADDLFLSELYLL